MRRSTRAAVATAVVGGLVASITVVGVALGAFAECRGGVGVTGPWQASGWSEEQVGNAATIMTAGADLGLPVRDQAIAVMTAMGESSLRNIDYGDWETRGVRNPDGSPTTSIGLFQQQDEWGTREQRLDPYTAATLFYEAMVAEVPEPERAQLKPTLVAHRTQVNADPLHYARYWPGAVDLVEQISGADSGLDAATGGRGC